MIRTFRSPPNCRLAQIAHRCAALVIAILALTTSGQAAADQSAPANQTANDRWEVRLGVLSHDIDAIAAAPIEDGVDINAELLVPTPIPSEYWLRFRPHVGVHASTAGGTSQAYAGITLTSPPVNGFWIAIGGGGAVHNGETDRFFAGRKALGNKVLFRGALEIGYDVTDQVSISGYYTHVSNAYTADSNQGFDTAGVRVGWRF